MTNKMTYAKALEIAMNAVKENKEVYDKLDALKASIAKKNSAERKPTATQKANEGYKTAILEFMEVGKKYTITDLMKEVVELADLSNQRVSGLVVLEAVTAENLQGSGFDSPQVHHSLKF